MLKNIINTALLAGTLWLTACSKEKPVEIPANVLGREKFTKVLVDFALSEAAANMNIKTLPVGQIDSAYAFNPLAENGITRSEYDTTLAFYSAHTALYKQVYEDVLAELSRLQARRDSLKTLPASK